MRFSRCQLVLLPATAAILCLLLHGGQAFVPASSTTRTKASPFHASARTRSSSSSRRRGRAGTSLLKMAVQTPPPKTKPELDEGRVKDEELLSVIELAGRKAAAAGFLPVLGAKSKEEQDIMWKLKVCVCVTAVFFSLREKTAWRRQRSDSLMVDFGNRHRAKHAVPRSAYADICFRSKHR